MKRLSIILILLLAAVTSASAQHHKSRRALSAEVDSLTIQLKHLKAMNEQLRYELEEMKSAYTNISASSDDGNGMPEPEGEFYEAAFDRDGSFDRDTLLALYYKQHELVSSVIDDSDFDSIVLASDTPDSVFIDRLARMNSFIKLPYNEIVRNYLVAYTQKHTAKMETVLGLAEYYMPIFEEVLDKYHLPLELKAMAVIESALNPTAVSRANAKGMWQFMLRTGKRYGLEINTYVDERMDVEKSAEAAARYLRDSYLIFGDWSLAIASYNCGAGNVNKAIRRSGGGHDFWEVYKYLPKETRGYVPSFIAALYMMTYYREHDMTPVPSTLPAMLDTLRINRMLHFEQVTHFTGMPKDELKYLNPQYQQEIIPGQKDKTYILRLPVSYTSRFIDHADSIYTWRDSIYFSPIKVQEIKAVANSSEIIYKVRSGDNLGKIAARYGVKVSDLQRWNSVKGYLKIGQKLVIYPGGKAPKSSAPGASASNNGGGASASGEYVTYKVKSGDSLSLIAGKFSGVTLQSLMKLNGLGPKSVIHPGMVLKIKKNQ